MKPEFVEYLKSNDYQCIDQLDDTHWVALYPQLFNYAIVVGRIGDEVGYEDRWDFKDFATAFAAMVVWKAKGYSHEPEGWVRHLRSGRRRPDGLKTSEVIRY